MTTELTTKPPIWFWIVSAIALLWNAMGVNAYLQQAYNTEAHRAQYNESQLELIANQPSWYTAVFALAVFAGILGCISLLLRKKWARLLFIISLLGVIGQLYYNLVVVKSHEMFTSTFEIVMTIMIPLIAVLLLWFSKKGIVKGWLK